MTDADFAAAAWSYPARTLASGTPGAPATRAEVYAAAVWSYVPRTARPAPLPFVDPAATVPLDAPGDPFAGLTAVSLN